MPKAPETELSTTSLVSGAAPLLSDSSAVDVRDGAARPVPVPGTIARQASSMTGMPINPVLLEFQNLKFEAGPRTILHNLTAAFEPGSLVAIMGPSGAGKTTLLNILSGVMPEFTGGKVLVNGEPRDMRKLRKYSAFVTQDDLLLPALTPRQALTYAATVRGVGATQEETKAIVDRIIDQLGMTKAADVVTGHPEGQKGLSGGQRKRLSIALEMVSTPPLIWLDEPTSGLDSKTAFDCVSLLRRLADEGHTIVCTIHQPSGRVFNLFHKVLMLAQGEIVYHGPTGGMAPFFASKGHSCPENIVPTDYVADLLMDLPAHEVSLLVGEYKASIKDAPRPRVPPALSYPKERYPTSVFFQFRTLLKRAMVSNLRDLAMLRVRIGSHVGMGLLLGCLYWQMANDESTVTDRQRLIFFVMLFLTLVALFPTVLLFPAEMAVFRHEHFNNWYSIRGYFVARSLGDMPFAVIPPAVHTTIVYFMSNLGPSDDYWRWGQLVAAMVLTAITAQALGILLGAAAPSQSVAVMLAPVAVVPPLLFCGFFVKLGTVAKFFEWLSHASYMRYSFFASAVAGLRESRFDCKPDQLTVIPGPVPQKFCPITRGEQVLENLDIGVLNEDYWYNMLGLLGFMIAFRIGGYLALRRKAHRRA